MMRIPPINDFADALASGGFERFATLRGFGVVCRDGRPAISRTSLFAEARIVSEGARWLLCLPVRHDSMKIISPALHLLRRLSSCAFTEYRVLHDEFLFTDARGTKCRCDLLLHRMPEGQTLDKAVWEVETGRLRAALELLRNEFRAAGVHHRNLKPSNVIWCSDERMRTVRYHYLAADEGGHAADREFDAVAGFIDSFPEMVGKDEAVPLRPYECLSPAGFDRVWPLRDMMCMVSRGNLYGYIDCDGRTVIEPQFTYAEDFCENRAVVEVERGRMGVIDRFGNYVLPPEYEMIGWLDDGCFDVRLGDRRGVFGYMGEVVVPLEKKR